jgi:hypothetical protein
MCKIIVGDKVQQERRKTKERVSSRLYTLGSQGRPSTEHSLYICSLAGLSCGGHAGPLHFLVFAAGDDIANNVVVQRQACYSLQAYLSSYRFSCPMVLYIYSPRLDFLRPSTIEKTRNLCEIKNACRGDSHAIGDSSPGRRHCGAIRLSPGTTQISQLMAASLYKMAISC